MTRRHCAVRTDDRYRTVAEPLVVDGLVLAGWVFEAEAGGLEGARRACRDTLDQLVACGLGWRSLPDGTRLFDPVEVGNLVKTTGLDGRTDYLLRRSMKTGQLLARSWWETPPGGVTDAAVPPPELAPGAERRFRLSWLRRFGVDAPGPGGSGLRLRLPLPAPDDPATAAEVIRASSSEPGGEIGRTRERLDLRLRNRPAGPVELRVEIDVVSRASTENAVDLSPTERELWLRPAEGLVAVTAKVRETAVTLAGDRRGEAALRAFWRHLLETMTCGRIHYDQMPGAATVDWVLDNGWYDCQVGSALLASLCRAVGIPARLVGGHVLYPLAPTNHFWMEAWLPERGWLPFDLLAWDLSAGGLEAAWSDLFFGRLDGRFVTQRFPRQVTGPTGVAVPPSWHLLQHRGADGLCVSLVGLDGSLILEDRIAVVPVGDTVGLTMGATTQSVGPGVAAGRSLPMG